MRDYEVVYIFDSSLEEDEIESKLDAYHDRLDGGEVTALEHWGKRRLAYEIADEQAGYYVVGQFRADPGSLEGFEQGLKHDEELLRHLIVLSEGELPVPPSARDEDEEEKAEDGEEEESSAEGDEGSAPEKEPGEEEDAGDDGSSADEDDAEAEER